MAGNKNALRNKGFSLLEVMVALGILSIGLLAMASLFSTSQRVLSISNRDTLAATLAQNKMEALRAIRPFPVDAEDTVEGMTRTWSIVAPSDAKNPRLWAITVKVFPTEDKAQAIELKSTIFY